MAAASKHVDLKIVFLGASGVGKTSIVQRYMENTFEPTQSTIGAAFSLKTWNEKKFGIWDTAGQEVYQSLSSFYCRGAGAAIIVYDVTSTESFEAMSTYLELLNGARTECFKILVGSKLDLVEENPEARAVATQDARDYAKSIDAAHLEVSAKAGTNIVDIFNQIGYFVFNETPQGTGGGTTPTAGLKAAGPPKKDNDTVSLEDGGGGAGGEGGKKKCC